MRQRRIVDQRHHRRDRDTVVGTQRGAVRRQPLAVPRQFDPAHTRVVRTVRAPLADHVEMALEDHDRCRPAPVSCGHIDHEVAGIVLPRDAAVPAGPGADVPR